jgi:hypothetical protein
MNPKMTLTLDRRAAVTAGTALLLTAMAYFSIPNFLRARFARPQYASIASSTSLGGYAMEMKDAELAGSMDLPDRKLTRTSSIDLVVKNPAEAVEKVRTITERAGGFLVKSQTNGAQDATNGVLTVRVPAARFEEVRTEIRKLGLRVESEQVDAEDVTKQYVDQQARLRNLHAQEAQYLGILKHAQTVKDTMEVSDKLNSVRGEIERQQAEFEALSRQVETVAITVSMHSEAEAQVFGLRWRPLYELKVAVMQGLQGLADYATAMFAVVFYLPAILLWLGTILVGAAVVWKILRLAGRVLFSRKKPQPAAV